MVILIFVMLVVPPVLFSYVRAEMKAERIALNEVELFLDKVTDKGTITDQDLNDLYLGIAATGGIYDVKVSRLIRISTLTEDGRIRTIYLDENYENTRMNMGDLVKVTVTEIGVSPAKRLLWHVLRIDEGKFEFSLVAAVR
jgi:hypothetical protein